MKCFDTVEALKSSQYLNHFEKLFFFSYTVNFQGRLFFEKVRKQITSDLPSGLLNLSCKISFDNLKLWIYFTYNKNFGQVRGYIYCASVWTAILLVFLCNLFSLFFFFLFLK